MKSNNNNSSIEQRKQEYLEKRRKESVNKVIKDYSHHFKKHNLNLRIIISPKNYPTSEDLVPRPYVFEDFFTKLKNGESQGENCNQINQFFDRQALTVNNYDFEKPIIIEKWFTISKNDYFPNSIIIKKDGVIFYNYHQNTRYNGKVIFYIKQLREYLKTLFICIIPKIYIQMEYDDSLILDVNLFNLNNCYIRETQSSGELKPVTISSESYEKSYDLKFQVLNKAHRKILRDIKILFR